MAAVATPEPSALKHEKKHKKEKSSKSDKKRAREEDAAESGHKRKKSKNIVDDVVNAIKPETDSVSSDAEAKKKKKKEKKEKRKKVAELEEDTATAADAKADKKKRKKREQQDDEAAVIVDDDNNSSETKKKKKKDKSKNPKHDESATENPFASPQIEDAVNADAMDIDSEITKPSKVYQCKDCPANPQFPFYSQTVSLYEPIYAVGWAQPVTNSQYQHLQHLQNRYVPSLRGVLLSYKNVTLGEQPGRAGAATNDEEGMLLRSQNEFGGGFGWITADVDLFVPSRGAWMEGSVNLQTEGHIGVVCFGKFNASIEARRLPPTWKWVANEDPGAMGMEETASVITADDHGVVRQIHSTGFWVDGDGAKVKGRVRFRIRNFDAGTSGETSYLSMEGTMLDKAGEKKLVQDEAEVAKMRKDSKSGRRIERRRAPEFSMTRFSAKDDEEEAVEETKPDEMNMTTEVEAAT